jgi:hypothetical protein
MARRLPWVYIGGQEGLDLCARKGRGCRVLTTMLPLPGMKGDWRTAQHFVARGVRS